MLLFFQMKSKKFLIKLGSFESNRAEITIEIPTAIRIICPSLDFCHHITVLGFWLGPVQLKFGYKLMLELSDMKKVI